MFRRLEIAVLAVVFAILALGLALVPLEMPWFTRTLCSAYSEVPRSQALPLAEKTRSFVVSNDGSGRAAIRRYMPDALPHLEDVRLVIRSANTTTAVLVAAISAWILIRLRRYRSLDIASGLVGGAIIVGVVTALAAGAAVVSFDAFFSAFHSLFFASGTWVFPSDSLLIRLFPEPFWAAAGLSWGALVIAICVAYLLLARAFRVGGNRREGP